MQILIYSAIYFILLSIYPFKLLMCKLVNNCFRNLLRIIVISWINRNTLISNFST